MNQQQMQLRPPRERVVNAILMLLEMVEKRLAEERRQQLERRGA